MSTTAIAVKDEQEAWQYIESALSGEYDSEVVELCFEHWPLLHVNIKGARYNSTLPTSLMRSLVDLQGHLNRVYAEVIYGKTAKSLTNEERAALEIVFKVEPGSSQVVADLSGFFSELAKNAMDKMTGRQVVFTVLGVAAMWAGAAVYDSHLSSKEKSEIEANRHKLEMQLVEQQPRLLEIQAENISAYTNILKSVPDADQVVLQHATLTKDEIEEITKQERQSTELKRIDGDYLISALKIKPDSYKIDLVRVADGRTVSTDLFKGSLTMDEMDKVMKAFSTESAIRLNVVGRVRGDVITTATIVGLGLRKEADGNVERREVALNPKPENPQ